MPEFLPVTTFEDLECLNGDEITDGYGAGIRGEPEPTASIFTRSYWHGWRNGARDGGHIPADLAMSQLAQSVHAEYLRRQAQTPEWARGSIDTPMQ